MCLDTGRKLTEKDRKPTHGWKVFHEVSQGYDFPCEQYEESLDVPCDRWITAEKKPEEYTGTTTTYYTGFHVCKTKKMAHTWIVKIGGDPRIYAFVKVKIADVRIQGTQEGQTVYVCDKMFVPKKAKEKK